MTFPARTDTVTEERSRDTSLQPDGIAKLRRRRLEPADISELRQTLPLETDEAPATAQRPAFVTGGTPEKEVIQSVSRALDLLELLCASPHEMKLQEIAAGSGLNVSTCHHLLVTLVARRYVGRNMRNRTYVPGPRIMELAQLRISHFDFLDEALPYLEALRSTIREAIYLGGMSGTDLSILRWLESQRPDEAAIRIRNVTHAAHATAIGKAILAWLPETQIARVVAEKGLQSYTPATIDSLGALVENLRQIRRHGFALEDEEFELGLVSVATAIRDRSGAVIGAIGTSIPISRASHGYIDRLQQAIVSCATDLSRRFSPFIA